MGTQNYTTYGNNTWTVPANVCIVKVQLWGAGGGGGGGNATQGGGAGGGGAFAQLNAYLTVPGATHNITIGRGGNAGAGSGNGTNGSNTVFRHNNNANAAWAAFGSAGRRYNSTAVAGGTIANSSGDLAYAGGNGAGRNATTAIWAGSGGGSAGNNGNGTAGTNVGANAAGGAGGNGTSNSGGNAALNAVGGGNRPPGAGGAGGGATSQAGGRGGDGLVQISWLDPVSPPFSSTFNYSNGNIQTVSSGNWWTAWNTTFDIDNNQLFANNVQAGAIFYSPTATINQYGRIEIISFNNNGPDTSSMGLLFRYSTYSNNAYVVFASSSGNNLFVGQSNAASYNWFGTSPQTHNFNNGDVLAATIFGTGNNVTINVWKNPANIAPTNWNQWDAGVEAAWTFTGVTGTPIDTGKLLGLGGSGSAGATLRADNWYAGDAPAAPWKSNAFDNATFHDEALGGKLIGVSGNQSITFGAVSDGTVISLISGNATSNATFGAVSDATVTAAPTEVKLQASNYIANNASDNTTFQLTPPSGKNNTQFATGKISDDTNPIASISFNNTYTEVEWSISIGNNVANNSTIQFRVTNNGTDFNNYAQTPSITVGIAGNNGNNQFGNCVVGFSSGLSSTRAANLFATSLVSMGVSGPDSRIATFPVTAFSNATLGSTSSELANLVALLTSTMNLPSTSASTKTTLAALISTLTSGDSSSKLATLLGSLSSPMSLSSIASLGNTILAILADSTNLSSSSSKIANLTALLASIVSLHDDMTRIATMPTLLSSPLSLSSTSSFGSTIQAILADAASFTASSTKIASFQSIAASVLNITTASTILRTTVAGAAQSFTLTSPSSRIGTHLATASSPFSLHDTVASSILFAAIASQNINLSTSSDWSILSSFIAFCVETLQFNATDITGLQAVAQLSSAMTTTVGSTALANFVRTASSAFNMPSTSNRAKTLDAALTSLLSSLTTATERYDAQSTAQAAINIASTSTNLANLINRAIETFSLGSIAEWVGGGVGLLASSMGISSTALVSRFITAISLSALTFTTTLAPKLTFNVTLDEHVSLHDTIAILRTVATVCAEAFNIRDISYWLSATGAVSVTFHLAKGEITFALTKPSIEARLSKPTIDFD